MLLFLSSPGPAGWPCDQTTSPIQSVCRDRSTLSPKQNKPLQLSGSLCPRYSPLCQEFRSICILCRFLCIFLPYDLFAVLISGHFSPVKAFNAGVSGSEWCRSWDVLFPYLRLGHYVRLGGQDRSRVTVSKVTWFIQTDLFSSISFVLPFFAIKLMIEMLGRYRSSQTWLR